MIASLLAGSGDIGLFNVLQYITFRAAAAAVTAGLLTFLLIPPFIKRWRLKERISEDVPARHRAKEGTPSSGGVVVMAALLLSTALWALPNGFVLTALGAVVYLSLMGLADDLLKARGAVKRGMKKRWKLLLQFVLAGGMVFALYRLYPDAPTVTQALFFKNFLIDLGVVYVIFVLVVFAGTTNAFNLTDGLDGLAAGASLAPFAAFALIAYVAGHVKLSDYLNVLYAPGAGELTVLLAAVTGSLLGFLWYNSYPAELFMGDTGSQGLGGALAAVAVLTKQELLLALAAGLFVVETLSVALQIGWYRSSGGKRLFRRAPLHHHYEEKGFSEPKIVVRFWLASVFCALLALATLKIR